MVAAARGGGHAGLRARANSCARSTTCAAATHGRSCRGRSPRSRGARRRAAREPGLARTKSISSPIWAASAGCRSSTPTAAAEMQQAAERLAETAALVVIDLGQPARRTWRSPACGPPSRWRRPAAATDSRSRSKNFGRQARRPQPVELLVDGRRVQQRRGRSARRRRGGGRLLVPLRHAGRSRARGPRRRRRSGDRQPPLAGRAGASSRSACCASTGVRRASRSAARPTTWRVRLGPGDDEPSRGAVRARGGAGKRAVGDAIWPATTACSCATWPSSPPARPGCWTPTFSGGGSLVFFLGDQVLADRYNRELGGQGAGCCRPIAAARSVDTAAAAARSAGLSPSDRAAVSRPGRGRAADHAGGQVLQADSARGLAGESRAGHGRRAIRWWSRSRPRGRVVLVATSADTSWTAMPLWPSFVPLVQEMLACAIGGQAAQRNVAGRPAARGDVAASAAGDAGTIADARRPRAEPLRLRADGDADRLELRRHDAERHLHGPVRTADRPRANPSPSTSTRPRAIWRNFPRSSCATEVWPGVPLTTRPRGRPQPRRPRRPRPPRDLARALLYAVLGAVVRRNVPGLAFW